ncbi:MAG: cell division protein FtsA [Candidatus Omnitrophota bacterium]
MKKNFAVIDLGGEETFAVAASWAKNGGYILGGFYKTRDNGVPGDNEHGVYPLTERVRAVLSALSKKTGKSFHEVYAGISSFSVKVEPSSASVLISRHGREVTSRDMKRCVEIGSVSKVPLDREVLHKVVMGFSIDGERLIRDPEGLDAVKLGVEVNIVTVSATHIRNFSKGIAQAGYLPSGFVLSALACSGRILNEEDKIDRTVFISALKERTEVLFLSAGKLENCRIMDTEILERGKFDAGQNPGYEKFFKELSSMRGWEKMRRIVVSGMKAPPEEFLRETEKFSGLPVRVGFPSARPFEDLPEDGASYASVLGILDHIRGERRGTCSETNLFKKIFNKVTCVLDEYF